MSDSFFASNVRCRGPVGFGGSHRRGFLKIGLAGFASLSLPGLLKARSAQGADGGSKAKSEKSAVIMVWQPGGCSHLDTYDPKPD
ncbi:MAG: DUF1501 domain-containing protein, partial [Planctomycetota bacterium]